MKKKNCSFQQLHVWCCVFSVSSVVEFLIGWVKISWVFGQKSTRYLLKGNYSILWIEIMTGQWKVKFKFHKKTIKVTKSPNFYLTLLNIPSTKNLVDLVKFFVAFFRKEETLTKSDFQCQFSICALYTCPISSSFLCSALIRVSEILRETSSRNSWV